MRATAIRRRSRHYFAGFGMPTRLFADKRTRVRNRFCTHSHQLRSLSTQRISVLQVEQNLLQKLELGSTLPSYCYSWQHRNLLRSKLIYGVVIRATTRSTCNAYVTILCHKLNENVSCPYYLGLTKYCYELRETPYKLVVLQFSVESRSWY